MKHAILVLICILLSIEIYGMAIDDLLSFADDEPPIRSATFIGKDFAWIVTVKGELMITRDGGGHWETLPSRVVEGFRPISFSSPTVGWLIGRKGDFWKTIDGGVRWSIISKLKPHSDRWFFTTQLQFLDEFHGWAIELPGFVWQTVDGGNSWQEIIPSLKPTFETLNCLQFVDQNWGWIGGAQGLLFHTKDGGRTWQKGSSSLSPLSVQKIFFVDKKNGWALAGVEVFSTKNGGSNWRQHLLDKSADRQPEALSLFFLDKNNGWVVGVDRQNSAKSAEMSALKGIALHTRNGGQSWEKVNITNNSSLFTKVYFADRLNGWITSRDSVYGTIDGGRTWVNKLRL